ncbi:MAG: hypothetical protein ACOC9B_02355 [Chloroflexota bacterium]
MRPERGLATAALEHRYGDMKLSPMTWVMEIGGTYWVPQHEDYPLFVGLDRWSWE